MAIDLGGVSAMGMFAIIGMAVATYATRVGGFWLMGHVALSARLERFLRHTAGGVLIAIVTAAAMKGDLAMWVGLGAVFAVMVLLKRSMTAILVGMAVAAALRHLPMLAG